MINIGGGGREERLIRALDYKVSQGIFFEIPEHFIPGSFRFRGED